MVEYTIKHLVPYQVNPPTTKPSPKKLVTSYIADVFLSLAELEQKEK